MAEMLHGYNYEPEYTDEELELRNSVQAATAELPNFSDWCQCSCCRQMPTPGECVCCRSSDVTVGSLSGLQCITENRRMQTVVLNEDVLLVMYVQMIRDTGKHGRAPDMLDDK